MPYEDQKSTHVVHKQLRDLGRNRELQPIFTSKKIVNDLRENELKPPIVNQQSVVYESKCDLCDTNYIGYTRQLHQRVKEHKHYAIGKHHNVTPSNLRENFTILKKCRSKLQCLNFEMLHNGKKRPELNTQPDNSRETFFFYIIHPNHALLNYVFFFSHLYFVYISLC